MESNPVRSDVNAGAGQAGRYLLLTSVGTGQYKRITYERGGRSHATELAPAAVCALADPRSHLVGVLATEKARDVWFDELARQLGDLGVAAELILVPEGRDESELQQTVEALTQFVAPRVAPGDGVILDVTLGLRHLPFIYLAALSSLAVLHEVRIEGVYYAALDLGAGGTAPVLDLTPLVAMIEWHAAFRAARGWGDFRPLAERLHEDAGRLFNLAQGDSGVSRAANWAQRLARASASALPLEIGVQAAGFHAALRRLEPAASPLAKSARVALEALAEQTDRLPVAGPPGKDAKRAVTLDFAELERELALAERYARAQAVPSALIVLREWLVNVVVLLHDRASTWLDHGTRERAERRLHGISRRLELGLATADEHTVGGAWQRIHGERNAYAHAGFREGDVGVPDERLRQHLAACHLLLERLPSMTLSTGDGQGVLITPLGLSPGVLYSAVVRKRPGHAVIVTSAKARGRMDEALAHAQAPNLPCEIIEMQDPHDGFAEFRAAAEAPGLRSLFASASTVIVNITGGTTAMSHVAERLGDDARRLGTAVRRIALIDRRSAEEQRRDPYVLSDLVDLDEDR